MQLFFTIILTLLEHQLLTVKQKCTPSALAADPKIDVEAMFRRITNAVKVQDAHIVMQFAPSVAVNCALANFAQCSMPVHTVALSQYHLLSTASSTIASKSVNLHTQLQVSLIIVCGLTCIIILATQHATAIG